MSTKHTAGPWTVEIGECVTSVKATVESKYFTVAYDVTNEDAALIAAAPEMLQILRNITQSAPLRGLPLALEIDIQSACATVVRLGRNRP